MIADGLRPEILAIALADLRAGRSPQPSPPGSPMRSNSHVPEGLGSPTRTGPNAAGGGEEGQQTGTIAGAVAASWGGLTAPAPPPAAEVVAADDPRLAQASSTLYPRTTTPVTHQVI